MSIFIAELLIWWPVAKKIAFAILIKNGLLKWGSQQLLKTAAPKYVKASMIILFLFKERERDSILLSAPFLNKFRLPVWKLLHFTGKLYFVQIQVLTFHLKFARNQPC